jgi:hypothetical protein
LNKYDIKYIYIDKTRHSIKNSVLSIEDEDFQIYFESPIDDTIILQYILDGKRGRRIKIFAEDTKGIMITLLGCVFSATPILNGLIR